jgi:hypothetical protein
MVPQDDAQIGDSCRDWLGVAGGHIGEGNPVAEFIDLFQES